MSTLILPTNKSVEEQMHDARPTILGPISIRPPGGGLADIRTTPSMIIPPINTDIRFTGIAPVNIAEHSRAMSDMQVEVPDEFNWRESFATDTSDIKKKKLLISKPGNQALCGSCWAISGAGIVADNFVVNNQVDWSPNLSTTYTLSCYPQMKCSGGDPAQLFVNAANTGLVSNHCIDYSWCLKNPLCNGSALKHFNATKEGADPSHTNLSDLVPPCGCYCTDDDHLVYKIDNDIRRMTIGSGGVTKDNIALAIKQHIYSYGPVLGGFLVFNNFMSGAFSKVNGGVYLERGVYDQGELHFSDDQINGSQFKGGHAVAVIGWGVEKNILVDNGGKRADVPYWYVRNSWTENWADGGYFKMAMYPFNKMSQFENTVTVYANDGTTPLHTGGGFVIIKATKPPTQSSKLNKIDTPSSSELLKPPNYYCTDPEVKISQPTPAKPSSQPIIKGTSHTKQTIDKSTVDSKYSWMWYVLWGVIIAGVIIGVYFLYQNQTHKHKKRKHHSRKHSKRKHHR